MSFSSRTKNELSRIELQDKCCETAELSALIRMSGSIKISGFNKVYLKFGTENAAIARRIFSLIKTLYNIHIEVMVRKNKQLKKNNSYLILLQNNEITRKILTDTGVLSSAENSLFSIDYTVPKEIIRSKCCKRAYIRGSFLGGGSISDPEKTYHLELVTHNIIHAEDLSQIINSFGLNTKIVPRKDNYIVYLKEGEQIVDLLNIIGAHSSLLKLENIRILKEVRNNVNRLVNCETANLSKTINAAVRQVKTIEYLDSVIGIDNLPNNLIEIAKLRLEYKDISLKELGSKLSKPIGKSGVNHRLRKLEEFAEVIKQERGEL